jgi:hypothetical protein
MSSAAGGHLRRSEASPRIQWLIGILNVAGFGSPHSLCQPQVSRKVRIGVHLLSPATSSRGGVAGRPVITARLPRITGMHRRVRGVVGPGMASVASMAQHELVGDQGTPVNSQHESMQRHRSDDMGLKDARASESYKADYSMKEAPCGASHSTPSGETLRIRNWEHGRSRHSGQNTPSQGVSCVRPIAPESALRHGLTTAERLDPSAVLLSVSGDSHRSSD